MKKILAIFIFCLSMGAIHADEPFNPLKTTPKKTKFAIMIASYNNEEWVEWNLNSALSQEYDLDYYHIYYLNDCSTDNTLAMAKAYVAKCGKEHMVTFVDNKKNLKPIGNYYNGVELCNIPEDRVIVILDGDDALANSKVLQYLNRIYTNPTRKILLTYGQFREKNSGNVGFCSAYPKAIEKYGEYRKYFHVPSHLRTYYCWLFKKIKKEDLLYDGEFLPMAGDVGSMIPMMEMAKGHYYFIPRVLYTYNDNNPISEHIIDRPLQYKIDLYIRSLPSYEPLDEKVKRELDHHRRLRR